MQLLQPKYLQWLAPLHRSEGEMIPHFQWESHLMKSISVSDKKCKKIEHIALETFKIMSADEKQFGLEKPSTIKNVPKILAIKKVFHSKALYIKTFFCTKTSSL